MPKLRLRMHIVPILTVAVILTALLISPLSLFLQISSFTLSLDLDSSEGDQAVQSLDVSPNQDVSIQIFGKDIQTASRISTRFEYNATQVVYAGFDAGGVLPNPDVRVEDDTNPNSVQIHIVSLDSSALVNSGLIGTLRFRTTDAFSDTEILLVRAELSRSGQGESAVLNLSVALQVVVAPSPDFDGSGFVDLQDLSLLTKVFGYRVGQEQYDAKYDLNGDGEIRSDDFLIFIQSYGKWVQRAPVFTSRTYVTYFIDENTPGGEPIGSPISATDADGDILTYHLSGKDADLFAIDAGTGQIQTREGITYDYEYRTTYSVIVEVSDGQGGTARLLVIIKINDLKEPPSSPPSNFLVIPDDQSLTVHYAAVPDERGRPPVRGYHAEIRKGEDGTWGDRKTIYGRTNTSVYYHELKVPRYHDPYLINGQLYQVRVRAWNSDGAGEWSEPVSGTPVYVPPKEEPQLTQFQGEDYAIIDLSPFTGEGGKIIVSQAALPATIPQEDVEGVFAEVVEVAVSDAPDVPASAGFTLPVSTSLFDIDLMARVDNRDVAIGDALRTSVEICLPVAAVSAPVIVHYDESRGAWEMLERQRVDGDVICAFADEFSLFGVGERANRAPVVVGEFEAQMLRVGDEGVTVDVSGKFSDPDGDALTYETASSDDAITKVDMSGSMVILTPVAEGTAIITVAARDASGSNQTAEQTIEVTINKADEKLSFGDATVPDQTYIVGTQITTIQLPEATSGTGTISYTLTPALPDGLVLDAGTRTMSGTSVVAAETTEYEWRATDEDESTIELTFSITVEPSNQSPRFTSSATFNVLENTTVVGTVVAEDTDSDDSITGYEVSGGADQAQFAITDEGVLSFKLASDYERPGDSDTNNEYIVVVEATSGTDARELTAMQTLTVTVTDVDTEAPGVPEAPTVAEATLNSLKVQWSAPTNTGPAISAYDVRYILTSADETVDANWTVATDAWTSDDGGNLEYTISSLSQDTSYDVQVRAENDEGTSGWSTSVEGMTGATGTPLEANVAPVFTSASVVSVSENSTADIVTVTATDADSEDNITGYGIVTGADGDQFSIVPATGVLTFKEAPNYEDPKDVAFTDADNAANNNAADNNEYIVVVEATSGTSARELTARDTLTVTVSDVNEAPGVPATPTIAQATFNSLKVAWSVPTNTGPAITAYDVRHILSSASASDKMDDTKWTEVTAAWTSNNGGNLEYTISSLSQGISYDMQVRAENDRRDQWVVIISCRDERSANVAPVIASISPITVAENSTAAHCNRECSRYAILKTASRAMGLLRVPMGIPVLA